MAIRCLYKTRDDNIILQEATFIPEGYWAWKTVDRFSSSTCPKDVIVFDMFSVMIPFGQVSLRELKLLPQTDEVKVLAMKLMLTGELGGK